MISWRNLLMKCELLHNYQQHCLSICLYTDCYQEVLHSYPQLLLVLVVTSVEHSVSYNDEESVPVIIINFQMLMTCVMCWLWFVISMTAWKDLGLQLGLLYPTLKRIDLEQRGIINSCKIDMLSAWLQQQDNVSQRGVPSWCVLKAALKRMGEHETADRIHSNWWWVVTSTHHCECVLSLSYRSRTIAPVQHAGQQ